MSTPKIKRLPVFVYGTLMKGHPNFIRIFGKEKVEVQKAVMRHVTLCKPRMRVPFPYLVRNEHLPDNVLGGFPQVNGELITLPEKIYEERLDELDWLEGHPDHYERIEAEAYVGDKRIPCYVYALPAEYVASLFFDPIIRSGDWTTEVRDHKLYEIF